MTVEQGEILINTKECITTKDLEKSVSEQKIKIIIPILEWDPV